MPDEVKAQKWDAYQERVAIQKKKDKYYAERYKWQIDELKRVVKENGLEEELKEFPKQIEEYI